MLWLKGFIHAVSIGFLVSLCLQTSIGYLGGDPVQGIEHFTGKAAFNTLLITLLCFPLVRFGKLYILLKVRRLLGLYTFFWASLHLLAYLWLDLGMDWSFFLKEVFSHGYLTVGAFAWVILLALAITSNRWSQRRLGIYWKRLHYLVYIAILLISIHYYWSVKSALLQPIIYIGMTLLLLFMRYTKVKDFIRRVYKNRKGGGF